MHTKDKLAAELRLAGLDAMAVSAEAGFYHDFLSPHPAPSLILAEHLQAAHDAGNHLALGLRARHLAGEFDASVDESEEGANSGEGIAAISSLGSKR